MARFLSKAPAMMNHYTILKVLAATACLGAIASIAGCGGRDALPSSPSPVSEVAPGFQSPSSANVVRPLDYYDPPPEGGVPWPYVLSISPPSGPTTGGTAIMISGSEFVQGATVTLGTAQARDVVVVDSMSITATTPPGSGVVDVVVTNPDYQAAVLQAGFTYTSESEPPPSQPPSPPPASELSVRAISPSSGPTAGGTAVTISGSGFAEGATVSFGDTPATNVTVVDNTSITATTPPRGQGRFDVVVTNPDGQSGLLLEGFTYTAQQSPTAATITITSSGVNPKEIQIAVGSRVTFVNNNTRPHDMQSDPHPLHTDCPELDEVGFLPPGRSAQTGVFRTARTCGYHDHNQDTNQGLMGRIVVR